MMELRPGDAETKNLADSAYSSCGSPTQGQGHSLNIMSLSDIASHSESGSSIDITSSAAHMLACGTSPRTVQLKQLRKMIFILLIPIVIFTGVTAYYITEVVQSKINDGKLILTTMFCVEIGQVLHAVADERDLFALKFNQSSSQLDTELIQRIQLTDQAVSGSKHFDKYNKKHQLADNTGSYAVMFDKKQSLVNWLFIRRQRMKEARSRDEHYIEISRYTDGVNEMQSMQLRALLASQQSHQWKSLMTFYKLTSTVRALTALRLLGNDFLARGSFYKDSLRRWFLRNISDYETDLVFISRFQLSVLQKELRTTMKSARLDFDDITLNAINNVTSQGNATAAKTWYQGITAAAVMMKATQNNLAEMILKDLRSTQNAHELEVALSVLLCSIVLLACPFLVQLISHLAQNIQRCALSLASKSKELKKEKKKTEHLLYQMLPRKVAHTLTQKRQVEAEYFKSATVFFLDIEDFSKLVTKLTPMEVVAVLQQLYVVYDNIVDTLDVYKVETIANTYLCVSGLPKRNGDQHISEVVDMSLEILTATRRLHLLPLQGLFTVKVKIGINTGPVVAGVIGTQRPRYCIFGDTVNVAARMMSNGQGNAIHITHSTYNGLDPDVYDVVPRGEIPIKGKGLMKSYWVTGKRDQQADSNYTGALSPVFSPVQTLGRDISSPVSMLHLAKTVIPDCDITACGAAYPGSDDLY